MTEIDSNAIFMMSLDFELYWGTRDLESIHECRIRTRAIRPAITALLGAFREYEVHATWATVGLLFLKDRSEVADVLPAVKPVYSCAQLSPYEDLESIGNSEQDESCCFAASAIQEISETPFQEIATHTFSHYYCLEDGQTSLDFEYDLQAAIKAASKRDIPLRSIVFPRNQVNKSYLEYCRSNGILCYRGAGNNWMFTARKKADETLLRRASRIISAYLTMSNFNSVPMRTIVQQELPFDFPGSVHLRPSLMLRKPLQRLSLNRLYRGLEYAADNGHLFHLWCHPEDFSIDLDRKIEILRRVLEHVSTLRANRKLESLNMCELAYRFLGSNDKSEVAPVRSSPADGL